MHRINIEKTVYSPKEATDGKRILVMRIWPRGIRKTSVDLWLQDLGTSRELIKEWKTGKMTWGEFSKRYKRELKAEPQKQLICDVAHMAESTPVTLLCSCKNPNRCHRGILKTLIEAQL